MTILSCRAVASLWGDSMDSRLINDDLLKSDVRPVGRLYDGTPLYRFRYAGGPMMIGCLTADVVTLHPDAVTRIEGLAAVDYGRAVQRAAEIGRTLRRDR